MQYRSIMYVSAANLGLAALNFFAASQLRGSGTAIGLVGLAFVSIAGLGSRVMHVMRNYEERIVKLEQKIQELATATPSQPS